MCEIYADVFAVTARVAIWTGRRKCIIAAGKIYKTNVRYLRWIKVSAWVAARRGTHHQVLTENKRRRVLVESGGTHVTTVAIDTVGILYRQVVSTDVAQ